MIISRLFGFVLILSALFSSGCYLWEDIQSSQVGLKMGDGVKVDEVVGPGVYSDLGALAGLKEIDVSAKTKDWTDTDLVTEDKQPIGVTVAVTFARKRDTESVLYMWDRYRQEARDDSALERMVLNRLPSVAKDTTASYSLDELIGTVQSTTAERTGRTAVNKSLFDRFKPELDNFGVELLDIRFSNFAPHPQYLNSLNEKAQVSLQKEISVQKTAQLAEQLKQEVAQTSIELEQARRGNEVAEERNKVFAQSPQAYELERLKLLKGVVGDNAKIYFVPQGTDLTLFLSGDTGIATPIPAAVRAAPGR